VSVSKEASKAPTSNGPAVASQHSQEEESPTPKQASVKAPTPVVAAVGDVSRKSSRVVVLS